MLANVRKLGVERELRPFASATARRGGAQPASRWRRCTRPSRAAASASPLRAIREVTTQDGKPLQRYPLAVEQAFPPEPIYLLAAAMQGVVREGTGQGLKSFLPPEIAVAGKTGTTDEQRDAWFAGFTGDRLGVVWVGYDDNRAARLSGSAAALPIWGDMMAALAPEPLALARPDTHRDGVDRPAERAARRRQLPRARSSCRSCRARRRRERAPCSSPMDAAVEAVGEVGRRSARPSSAPRAGSNVCSADEAAPIAEIVLVVLLASPRRLC